LIIENIILYSNMLGGVPSDSIKLMFDGVQGHFQQQFSHIVAVSFIGRGKRMTRRKPPTDRDSNSQHKW
jgi:hypothetical protein